jgi:hypothetical protein
MCQEAGYSSLVRPLPARRGRPRARRHAVRRYRHRAPAWRRWRRWAQAWVGGVAWCLGAAVAVGVLLWLT